MNILDKIPYRFDHLSEELSLLKPNFNHSVAGVVPEVLRNWNGSHDLIHPDSSYSRFDQVSKLLNETHPSGYDQILLILVDGLGVSNLYDIGGLISEQLGQTGTIASSCYPTITSTVMTSIIYGTQPALHGLVGYNVYNESLDKVWNALRLRYHAGEGNFPEVLDQVSLADLVSGKSLTQIMAEKGLSVSYLVPYYLQPPGLGNILHPSFSQEHYRNHGNLITKVRDKLQNNDQEQFICAYFPDADGAAHSHGPNSDEYRLSLRYIEQTIERIFKLPEVEDPSTLTILTSDHGMVPINSSISKPMTRSQWLSYKDQGTLLSFSGRTVHAYAINGNLSTTYELLEDLTRSQSSIIINKKQAIELAGGDPIFSNRIGDYNILSAGDYMFHVPNSLSLEDEEVHAGHHGSLTPDEVLVPVVIF